MGLIDLKQFDYVYKTNLSNQVRDRDMDSYIAWNFV